MQHIPDISQDPRYVRVRENGRFYTGDFTLWPQWYFPGTYYLPYLRARPPDVELPNHELNEIWYDIKPSDFVKEPGSAVEDLGRLKPSLSERFGEIRVELAEKIKRLVRSNEFPEKDCAEMLYSDRGMCFSSLGLICAPQSYIMTVLTVTSFQRHYLEALACYEYLTIWRKKVPSPDKPLSVDPSIVGAVTCDVEVAMELHQLGVPVWLVRPPSKVPLSTKIVMNCDPSLPTMTPRFLPSSRNIYEGDASALKNRACQSLRMGNIRLGHSSFVRPPGDMGDPNWVNRQGMFNTLLFRITHFYLLLAAGYHFEDRRASRYLQPQLGIGRLSCLW